MSTKLKAVVGNTAPPYTLTCERDDGTIIVLTNCVVTMKLYLGTTQTNTTSGHDACSIVNASLGQISWTPKTGDLPSPGTYKGDVYVDYSNGAGTSIEVLYNNAIFKVRKKLGA